MEFITIVLAWALVQYWGSATPVHRDEWFNSLLSGLGSYRKQVMLMLVTMILLPALAVSWVISAFDSLLFGLPYQLLNILLLLYCMGRGDFFELVNEYKKRWQNEDYEGAYLFAHTQLKIDELEGQVSDSQQLNGLVKRELLYLGYERWFAVVFYFLLFGVFGALVYRLTSLYRSQCRDENENENEIVTLDAIITVLDWIPARLLALAFAITGDFVATMTPLMDSLVEPLQSSKKLLSDAAHAALMITANPALTAEDNEINALQALLSRSAVAWLAIIAFLTLLS